MHLTDVLELSRFYEMPVAPRYYPSSLEGPGLIVHILFSNSEIHRCTTEFKPTTLVGTKSGVTTTKRPVLLRNDDDDQ